MYFLGFLLPRRLDWFGDVNRICWINKACLQEDQTNYFNHATLVAKKQPRLSDKKTRLVFSGLWVRIPEEKLMVVAERATELNLFLLISYSNP